MGEGLNFRLTHHVHLPEDAGQKILGLTNPAIPPFIRAALVVSQQFLSGTLKLFQPLDPRRLAAEVRSSAR
jgi:hypothetical protein